MKFTIKEEKANRTGSLPGHFDIIDSAGINEVSVWTTHELAQDLADMLEYRTECKELIRHLKRPGLIGGRHGG